jgi:hypothetical protein
MYRLNLKNNEATLAAGIGNSSTVDSATLVRVTNISGGTIVVGLQTAGFVGYATMTMLQNTTEIVEKRGSDLIHVLGGDAAVVKIGFTN